VVLAAPTPLYKVCFPPYVPACLLSTSVYNPYWVYERHLPIFFTKFSVFRRFWQKLRKAPISFAMSVRLSVRMEQFGSHFMDFLENWHLRIFRTSVEKIQFSLKSDRNNGCFTWKQMYIILSYLTHFFLEWEMFQTKFVKNV